MSRSPSQLTASSSRSSAVTAAVPMTTQCTPMPAMNARDFGARMPPPYWTGISSALTMFSTMAKLVSSPLRAASRSMTCSASAPWSCQ